MQTYFDIVPADGKWVVRCQAAEYGRFASQMQAFNAAVTVARRIKQGGRPVQIRVLRDGVAPELDCLDLQWIPANERRAARR